MNMEDKKTEDLSGAPRDFPSCGNGDTFIKHGDEFGVGVGAAGEYS